VVIWLSRSLSTWRGKIGLGLVVFATLLVIAFMRPINGTFSIAAVRRPGESNPSQGILIDREHFVQGPGGDARAIIRVADGHLVVAGVGGVGWAFGAGPVGNITWIYKEPVDPQVKTHYQSEFHGVVPLADGHVLLCGEGYSTNDFQVGLITVLDGEGHLIERRTVFPNDDTKNWGSSFQGCIPWGDGFALMGRGTDGKHGFFWLMKLDQQGKKVWDKIGPEIPGFAATAMQDGSLVVAGNIHGGVGGVTLARFDKNGGTLASRTTDFQQAEFVRPLNSTNLIQVVLTDRDYHDVLLTLDGTLRDVGKPTRLNPPNIRDGCAYELPDGSIVKFGSLVGSVYRASVGWMNRRRGNDQLSVLPVPNPHYSSANVEDAVAISATEFVTVRSQNAPDAANTGLVLSWITLK
jgi:hypothetical protein